MPQTDPSSLCGPQVVLLDLTVPDPPSATRLQDWLAPEEQARLAKLKNPVVAHRFLLTRAVTREILGVFLQMPPARVPIVLAPAGKPSLAHSLPLAFSISHTETVAAIAFWRHDPLGIDVQQQTDRVEIEPIIRRYFADEEYRDWLSYPEPERRAAFFRAWVRKESVLKATGEGISGLAKVRVSFADNDLASPFATHDTSREQEGWQSYLLSVAAGCWLCVSWQGPTMLPDIFHWHSSRSAQDVPSG